MIAWQLEEVVLLDIMFCVLQCDFWPPVFFWVAWVILVMVTFMALLRMMTETCFCGDMCLASSTNVEPLNKLEVLVTR